MHRDAQTNQMLSLRLLCNVFGSLTEDLMEDKHVIMSHILGNLAKAKTNEVAAATLVLNYSIVVSGLASKEGNQNPSKWSSVDSQTEIIMASISLIEVLEEPEAIFRILVAIGNLVSGNPTMADLFKNLSGDSMLNNYKASGALPKIKNCASQIHAVLAYSS